MGISFGIEVTILVILAVYSLYALPVWFLIRASTKAIPADSKPSRTAVRLRYGFAQLVVLPFGTLYAAYVTAPAAPLPASIFLALLSFPVFMVALRWTGFAHRSGPDPGGITTWASLASVFTVGVLNVAFF